MEREDRGQEALLKFPMPEAEDELRLALDAPRWYGVVWDFDNDLRGKIKHGEYSEETTRIYEEIRTSLREMMDDHGVDFE